MGNITLRTEETQKRYEEVKMSRRMQIQHNVCPLCTAESLQEFQYWRIVENEFPYDRIAAKHHIAVLKRHTTESKMTNNEREEFRELKEGYINENYEFVFESVPRVKTIPAHHHLHLIVVKQRTEK